MAGLIGTVTESKVGLMTTEFYRYNKKISFPWIPEQGKYVQISSKRDGKYNTGLYFFCGHSNDANIELAFFMFTDYNVRFHSFNGRLRAYKDNDGNIYVQAIAYQSIYLTTLYEEKPNNIMAKVVDIDASQLTEI